MLPKTQGFMFVVPKSLLAYNINADGDLTKTPLSAETNITSWMDEDELAGVVHVESIGILNAPGSARHVGLLGGGDPMSMVFSAEPLPAPETLEIREILKANLLPVDVTNDVKELLDWAEKTEPKTINEYLEYFKSSDKWVPALMDTVEHPLENTIAAKPLQKGQVLWTYSWADLETLDPEVEVSL